MNKFKYIYRLILIAFAFSFVSCDDWFDLHPESETIFQDFWKDESDVLSMVGSCYRGMNEPEFVERLIVWGELRSDNVIKGQNPSGNIERFLNATLNAANDYTSWTDFYEVINYCNNVIEFAPGVRQKDPDFSEGQLRAYIAEVKGIRALCYFTLVRTFRDVPFITYPVVDDSKPFDVPQSSSASIIDYLIKDLISVENNAVSKWEDKRYAKGRITQNAIRALIADMSLWINDYETCNTYCNLILNDALNPLSLEPSQAYNANVFVLGNSKESIFELQFEYNNISNYVLYEMYQIAGRGSGGRPGYNTNQLTSFNFIKSGLFPTTDLRAKDAFVPIEVDGYYPIMKYIGYRNTSNSGDVKLNDYELYINVGSRNWIFYRLSDVYLMKAEALVERNRGTEDLEEAFRWATKSYDRANPDLNEGSLNFSDYQTQFAMRNFVFDERQRELLFEGKRYFDLLRRINREGTPASVVNTYLVRKYADLDEITIKSKLSDIDALYMPINKSELKMNTSLVQNPFYVVLSDIDKK